MLDVSKNIEDTKGEISSHNSKKDRSKERGTSNTLQNITHGFHKKVFSFSLLNCCNSLGVSRVIGVIIVIYILELSSGVCVTMPKLTSQIILCKELSSGVCVTLPKLMSQILLC